ncbi:RNA-binding S4 domain protein [Alkaliphilus metalliredigens QYMF]|uniref:RNA-binding S4 domain protein n=1 Tax=Alkaliphilus metalliredigens (strain QYMF) TaxID=293826 RepID=A6TRY3_ALKMQ|nr:YlmH/Sll1252 family protein [Alkaliphilus metalliredigens]ABR48951.1 RNA-binding S4 domain protein [Alkaliphilus metalliredigens QYMF]
MLNRDQYIEHIQDEKLKLVAVKLLDKVEMVMRKHEVKYTNFLTPYEIKHMLAILNTFEEICFFAIGGHEDAERKTLVIFQAYLDPSDIESPIAAIEIQSSTRFNQLMHRDFLGAILGLGIKREKIGDILLQDDICQVVITTELRDYVLLNLVKVGNMSVKVREIELEEIKAPDKVYKEIRLNVASLRLDAIVSAGFKLSRSEAHVLIQKQRCSVNWEVIDKPSNEVSCGDLISIRGKGRMIVENIEGTTRSGRTSIKLHKLI